MRAFDWLVVIVMGVVGWLIVSFLLNRAKPRDEADSQDSRDATFDNPLFTAAPGRVADDGCSGTGNEVAGACVFSWPCAGNAGVFRRWVRPAESRRDRPALELDSPACRVTLRGR